MRKNDKIILYMYKLYKYLKHDVSTYTRAIFFSERTGISMKRGKEPGSEMLIIDRVGRNYDT